MTCLAVALCLWAGRAVRGQTIIVDNADPGFTVLQGTWNSGSFGTPVGQDYRWALTTGGATTAAVEWRPELPAPGPYEVAVHFVSGANRATDAPFTVHHAAGATTVPVDQQQHDSTWVPLGTFDFNAGTGGAITLANAAGPTVVIADAVRLRSAEGRVPYDHPLIRIGGASFARVVDFALRLDRIDPALLADPNDAFAATVAVLTTGVTVRFRTDSATIRATFNHLSHVVTEGTGYVVFQDGVFDRLVSDLEVVESVSNQPGAPVTWEIVCPSYDQVTLSDLVLDPNAALLPLPADRRLRYAAFGDSITHGSELDADTKADSTTSYPWVLAANRGWELHSLAVGGSQVAPAFGAMQLHPRPDVITILWGVNDKARDNDLARFTNRYDALLGNLRAAHPRTPIHCITMITCNCEGPGGNGYTLDDYREAIATIVATRRAAGDCHLHLLRGEDLTTLADLTDGTHLSVAGAAAFASELAGMIPAPWGDFDNDGTRGPADWQGLLDCLAGPDTPAPPGPCEALDVDCDTDLDLHEVLALQQRYDA